MDDLELTSKVFREQAVQAYLSSRILLATTLLYPVGIYNAHLACECMLKSLTAQLGSQPVQKHDLLLLNTNLHAVSSNAELTEQEYLYTLSWLNPYQELGRYGALARPQNDPNRVTSDSAQVRGTVSSQPLSDIKRIDFVFAKLRAMSNVQNDMISKIIAGDTIPQWNFPLSIRKVLLSQNDYITSS